MGYIASLYNSGVGALEEGPVISKNLHNGSYYVMDVREPARESEGADTAHTMDPYAEAKRPWNIAQLRPYYS